MASGHLARRVWSAARARPTSRPGVNITVWAVALLVVVSVLSSLTKPASTPSAAHPAAAVSTPLPSAPLSPAGPPSAASAFAEPGATTTGSVPTMAETTGGVVVSTAGAILPDSTRTPGARNSAVTQADISQTICVSGWTATIRPDSNYTTSLKEQQLASGYAFHGDTSTSDYEEDHLISLELGGSASSVLNLWPEPYNTADGARTKDALENKLHSLVCSGSISLAAAQHSIATNWWSAYRVYIGTAPASHSAAPTTVTTAPAPAPVGPPAGATALCNDGTYSYAAHHQGACSHHGGVKIFYQ